MPSVHPGYEYDIFVSYRQNDNRSGWVSEFVGHLQEELAATIKDPVSVYFDANPHDGLRETHSVDKSLEGKLKCLIIIPILSQTYCDPKSFAWQHEFCAFTSMARQDQLGLDVRLKNGNVASRVLPVKIHDLEEDDKGMLEKELGGALRAVDFVFSSPGVSRPLTPEDKREENSSRTFYKDQINKVARGIKELMTAMQQPVAAGEIPVSLSKKTVVRSDRRKMAWIATAVLFIGLASFASFYFLGWGRKLNPAVDKSIAVLPFKNMSGDKSQDYFSDGMMDEILNQLVKIGDLKVTSRTSSMLFRDSKKPLSEIAAELGVANILEGSVQRSGNKIRIITQLIDAATDKHIWSETFDRDVSDVFVIQTEISKGIARHLSIILSAADKKQLDYVPTQNHEAYDLYLKSLAVYDGGESWSKAIPFIDEAIRLDSTFAVAYAKRAFYYGLWYFNKWDYWEGKEVLAHADMEKALHFSPEAFEVKLNSAFVLYLTERKYKEALAITDRLRNEYPNNPALYSAMGSIKRRMGLYRESEESFEKCLELDPGNVASKYEFARLYSATRNYDRAIELTIQSKPYQWFVADCLLRQGNLQRALEVLDEVNDAFSISYYKRDFKKYLDFIDGYNLEAMASDVYYWPKSLLKAMTYFTTGDLERSRSLAKEAISFLENKLIKSPGDFRIHAALGVARALAGDAEKAIESGNEAIRLMPVAQDAFVCGPAMELNMVSVYLYAGKYDLCMDKLEYLLGIPAFSGISVGLLQLDPLYDKLRKVPRFQKMLKTEYRTVY